MYSEEMELDPAADRDPISDPGPREHFVKCRITRNRKGVRGQSSSDYHCTVDIGLDDTIFGERNDIILILKLLGVDFLLIQIRGVRSPNIVHCVEGGMDRNCKYF